MLTQRMCYKHTWNWRRTNQALCQSAATCCLQLLCKIHTVLSQSTHENAGFRAGKCLALTCTSSKYQTQYFNWEISVLAESGTNKDEGRSKAQGVLKRGLCKYKLSKRAFLGGGQEKANGPAGRYAPALRNSTTEINHSKTHSVFWNDLCLRWHFCHLYQSVQKRLYEEIVWVR